MKGILTLLGGAAVWATAHLGLHGTVGNVVQAVGAVSGIVGARVAIAPQNAAATLKVLGVLPTGVKTVLGAVLALVTYLLSPAVVGSLSPQVASILMTVSAILIALGITHAAAATVMTP